MNILLVAEGCLMMQFRNNAVYAVAVFMLLLLILQPKKEKLGIWSLDTIEKPVQLGYAGE